MTPYLVSPLTLHVSGDAMIRPHLLDKKSTPDQVTFIIMCITCLNCTLFPLQKVTLVPKAIELYSSKPVNYFILLTFNKINLKSCCCICEWMYTGITLFLDNAQHMARVRKW